MNSANGKTTTSNSLVSETVPLVKVAVKVTVTDSCWRLTLPSFEITSGLFEDQVTVTPSVPTDVGNTKSAATPLLIPASSNASLASCTEIDAGLTVIAGTVMMNSLVSSPIEATRITVWSGWPQAGRTTLPAVLITAAFGVVQVTSSFIDLVGKNKSVVVVYLPVPSL